MGVPTHRLIWRRTVRQRPEPDKGSTAAGCPCKFMVKVGSGHRTRGTFVRILIVEDETIVAMDLQATLERMGHTVVGRTSRGEDVLALARTKEPDLILMDIRLAGVMDGIEAARQVRDELRLPFIFLTAHTDEATLKQARAVEPYGYIVKPLEETAIRTQIEIAEFRHEAEQARAKVAVMEAENKRLADINALRAQFVSMASHELNTPLTPIILCLQVLNRTLKPKATPEELKSLDLLDRNFRRLADLVEHLRLAAQIQSGRLWITPADVDVQATVENVALVFRARSEQAGVALHVKSMPVHIRGDAARLGQVVTNLLDNAFKFTPRGGRIDVHVTADATNATIRVSDSGIGLTAENIARLYQPFSMVQDVGTQGQGTGLGLYISREIAELHGGFLTCSSQGPGKGSEFKLVLPIREPSASLAPTRESR